MTARADDALWVRPAGPFDWRAWRDLRLRALTDSPDAFGVLLAEAQAKDDAGWKPATEQDPLREALFAMRGNTPVGMAVVRVTAERPDHAALFAMWVAPEVRRAGLGRALIRAALRWARSRAVLEVGLRVATGNDAARRLYGKSGFIVVGGRVPLRDGEGPAADAMVARLAPLVMGVVNVTPDSFSDGGRYLDPDVAVAHGLRLVTDGADILDIGGEATGPGARPIAAAEELARVLPVIERLASAGATLSIDTTKAPVARAAVAAGARIVNDVSGGLFDAAMSGALGHPGVTYICGHLRGGALAEVFADENRPVTWTEVAAELAERLAALPAHVAARAWVDPGIGFGKGGDPATNQALVRHAGDLGRALGRPVVVGPSRKRYLRRVLGIQDPTEADLDGASVAECIAGAVAGASVLRVHNVALLRTALSAYNKD